MPKYIVNGKTYNIPDDKVAGFESRYPNATVEYHNEGKTYQIPLSKRNGFLKQFPNASYNAPVEQPEQDATPTVETETPEVETPAVSTGETPLTEQDRIRFSAGIEQMKRRTRQSMDDFNERMATMREYHENAPLGGGQTAEGRMMFNPESGRMEQTYITPAGNRYSNKAVADMESFRYRQAADMSVGGQLRRANLKLAELKAKRAESASRVHDEAVEDYKKNKAPLAAVLFADTYSARQMSDRENSALDVAIRQTEELIKDLEEQKDREGGIDVGFWRGFGRVAGDFRTWDFGMGDLRDAMTMVNADALTGDNATEGEREAYNEMMGAIHNKEQAEQMYGDNASFWNRAGVMTGYMPSFMLDFVLTGGGFEGISLASKGGTRLATKVVGKEIVDDMVAQGFKSYVKNNGVKGFGQYATNWTIKALGTTADDLLIRAPLMTNTTQLGKTTADIIDRKLGYVVVNEDGTYDFSNDKTWGSAIWQGEANAIIENYSEMFGAHLDPVITFGNMSKLANVIGAKRLGGVLAKADAGALNGVMGQTQALFNKMGVSDYFGEVTEEYYGQLWRTMLNLDDAYQQNPDGTRTNLLATGQFHGDIWGGMALSMGLMGAGKHSVSAINYASMKHGVNKADALATELLGKEIWEPLRTTIDLTANEDIGSVADGIVNDKDFTDEERAAVLTYMERSLNLRGYNLATLAEKRGGEQDDDVQAMNESYLDGYNIEDSQEMNDAKNMLEYQRQRVSFLDDDFLAEIANEPGWHLDYIRNSEAWNDEERAALLDYLNAKQVYDGMMQRVRDDIDGRIDQSNAMVDARTNRTTGMIQPATMKQDDRRVYVVNGNLVQYEDGSGIDNNASDGSIIIRDAETGTLEQVSPESILNIDTPLNPYDEKETAAEAIRQQYAQEAANKIDGVVTFNPGDTYTLTGENGQARVQVVANEQGIVDNGDGTVNVSDGVNVFPIAKETIQQQVEEANLARLAQFEQARAAENAAIEAANRPQYAFNDNVTLRDDEGNIIHGQIAEHNEADDTFVLDVDSPIGGKYAPMLTRAELESMIMEHNGTAVKPIKVAAPTENTEIPENYAQNSGEIMQDGNNVAENIPENGNIDTENIPTDTHEAEQQPSAFERVPKDEQGNPIYEQADTDTAWDAIVEQTEGDEVMAQTVADGMVADKEAALKKIEKAKAKGGVSIAEKIAAEKERKAAIDAAKQELDIWKKIAGTANRRKMEADAERRRIASEEAARLKAEEEKLRAEREEAERIEREALNGVPDMVDDTPQDARARGYRRVSGHKIDRQEPIQGLKGKEIAVKFSDNTIPTGRVAVIEAEQLQPSHIGGQRNPLHFIDEAQPKERNDEASVLSARKIAGNIRPEEITSSVTAYTGAPTVNARGEAIQGNSRSDALRQMWESHPEQSAKYKQYLTDHAQEFGLNAEDIAGMQHPVLVNMLDVEDTDAITLGQYVAQDTESGGTERIKPKNALQRMGTDIRTFANLLLKSTDEETSFAGLVDNNGVDVLKWMSQRGFITPTQYKSAFDSKGNLTAEAKNDLRGIMYQSIFKGGSTRLEEMFNAMPAKAQKAILATAFRDYDSPSAERMIEEIQNSIRAYYALSQDAAFVEAKTFKEARMAAEGWKIQYQIDDVTGDSYLPAENFSNFALLLATMYKGENQSIIQGTFNKLYDLIQGTQEENLFEQPDNTPRTLAQAIKETLNITYNGQRRSNVLVGDSSASQRGQQGSTGDAATGERIESGERTADSAGSIESDSRQGRTSETYSVSQEKEINLLDPRTMSEEEKQRRGDMLRNAPAIDVKKEVITSTPELSARKAAEKWWDENVNEPALYDTEAGEVEINRNSIESSLAHRYGQKKLDAITSLIEGFENAVYLGTMPDSRERGVIDHYFAYPIMYDGELNFVFCRAMQDANKNRLYVHEVFVGEKIKKGDTLQTAASKPHGGISLYRDILANVLETPEQSSLLERPNFAQYPTEQELSDSKDTTNPPTTNELGEKNAVSSVQQQVEAAEAEVNTNPTDKQKEAGNYKKGHVQIGTFNVTIEQPKGSVRSGVDKGGKKWEIEMQNTYGYIRGTEGVDGDHIDVFLSDDIDGWNGRQVYVVDQRNKDGSFDEHKVMLGFNDINNAEAAYLSNYEKGWHGLGAITGVAIEDFEKWIASSHRKTKAFAEYKTVKTTEGQSSSANRLSEIKSRIEELHKEQEAAHNRSDIFEEARIITEMNELFAEQRKLEQETTPPTLSQKSDQVSDQVSDAPYSIAPAQYTTKKGKVLDMHLVKFGSTLTKEQQRAAKELAKADKGWYDSKQGGFMMRSEESAKQLAETIISNEEAVSDAQPVSLADTRKVVEPQQERQPSNPSGNRLVSDERYAELRERMRKKLGGQMNIGIDPEILAIGTEMAVYHLEKGARKFTEYAKAMIADLGDAIRPYLKAFYNGARNLPEVESSEIAADMTPYDEVQQFNVASFDKEHSDPFTTAEIVVAEQAHEQEAEQAKQEIINNRNNERRKEDEQTAANTETIASQAEAVAGEAESDIETATTEEQLNGVVATIDKQIDEVNKQLALLGYYEADIDDSQFHESYGYMRSAEKKAVKDADALAKRIVKDLGIDPATIVDKKGKKRKVIAQANIAPAGGDVSIRLPLSSNRELYINVLLEPDYKSGQRDNLFIDHIYLRIENPTASGYKQFVGRNVWVQADATYTDMLDEIRAEIIQHVPEFELPAKQSVTQSEQKQEKPKKSKKKAVTLQQSGELGLFDSLFDNETNNEDGLQRNDAERTERVSANGNRHEQGLSRSTETGSESEQQSSRGTDNGGERTGDAVDRTVRPRLSDTVTEQSIEGKRKKEVERNRKLANELKGVTLHLFDKLGGEREISGIVYYELANVFHCNDNVSGPFQATRKELDAILKVARKSDGKETFKPKNTRNNHSERGKDHAPTSVDARIEANIKAIELAKQLLESGEQATEKQMQTLRKFSGWGGLGKAFSEGTYYAPNNTAKKLRELLGEKAYQEAVMSANSAYYTPAYVVDTLWDIAEKMGFEGGNILEGSAGIGNILGQMPTHISERSDIHAIEIDGTSGSILSLLYPDANVEIQGFEQTHIDNGTVDLAISNVPFVTGLRVNDTTGDKDLSKKFHNIHDFCIAKNVRKLREGGLGIFITSNGTLDNSKKLRDWIVSEGGADFVGAFRMHNKTFGGTGVTSDIIVIRKRVNGQKSANAIDVSTVTGERMAEYDTGETRKVKGKETPVIKQLSMDYNRYFVEHPENMAGEMHFAFEKGDTFRPTSKGLYPKQDKKQEQMLAEFVQSFTAEEFGERTTDDATGFAEAMQGKKLGKLFVKDGKLYTYTLQGAKPLEVNANKVKGHTKVECFEAYTAIKEALAEVLAYQTSNESDEGLKPLLDSLNRAYDDFVATYGHFNKNTAIAFLRNDVDYASVFTLERFEETADANGNKVQKFGKTDVFSKRVVEKEKEPTPTNVKDGIIASIFKFGRVDVPYIAEQLGVGIEDVKKEIIESGYGFENPATRQIEASYQYLSGNVREKLRQAEENNENGAFDRNIKALQEVVPMDIPAHLIDFTLGSSWIEPKMYEEYVKERTEVGVQFTAVGGTWFMNEPYFTNYEKNRAMGVTSEMLGRTVMGHTLIEAAIQNRSITVSTVKKNWDGSTETITDKEATQACAAKIDEIRQDFKEWARQKMQSDAEMSERMERIYNDTFNNYVPMSIPDDFVPEYFGGASHKFKMRPHQGRAIVRGTMQPLLLAHEVGTGKTFTLISTAMEMRRLGTARKPMIVVQNATVGQFVASAKELYPNAKILTLEEADRSAEGRKNFYAKIRYNDWDMIVVPQSTFEFIPDSEERQMAFVQSKIEEKMLVLEKMKEADPNGSSMITRQAEREIAQLEEQLAGLSDESAKKRTAADEKKRAVALQNAEVKAMEMLDRRTDDVENFDDMGIDALLIDEAHEYKHLGFATAMQRGVKGVDPSYSKKSQGVYLKTQAVLEKNNGRNVIFATGTPISNTAAEIWTFMRYLMPADTMEEYGIYYFDDFVRNFGNIQQMLEFTTSGKFKENNRFAGYVNLPELVRIWSGVSDTVLTREAGGVSDKIPEMEGGKAQDLYLPQTRALRSIMKYVKAQLEEYDKMSGKEKKENSHIPLTMYGIAKAAAVDARLVQSDAEDDAHSKTNEAVRQTLRSLKETADYKGTVAIFADNYQNKESGFNLYEDIRAKLIAEGVPADEIVVIKSGMTVKKKLEIFEKVNRGEIRVILGSTFTLGTGVNIQERLHTLIHLDAPNRPMDYTQRNGRILRQGNLHKAMGKPVRVLRFGVEDSLDVTAYQRLKTKGAIADSIMNGKQMMANSMTNRVLEEEEDVFGDTVAQLSGSEYAMLKNNAEKNVRKYASRKKQWEADQTYIHNAKPRIKAFIKDAEKRIEDNSRYLEAVQSAFPDGKFTEIIIGKHRFASVEAMEDFFKEHNKSVLAEMKQMKDGEIAGEQKRELTIQIGDFSFVVTTKLTRQTMRDGATLFNDVERKMHYSCPELGIEDIPVRQNLLRNAIEDITKNVITGRDFAERLEAAHRNKKHNDAELEQLLSREGKPFEYEAELAQAREQYEEYAEKMKKELEEKEAKYAEMDATVEAADNLANAEEDDVLYRSDEQIEYENTLRRIKSRYGLRGGGQSIAIYDEEDLERVRMILDKDIYEKIESKFYEPNVLGCSLPKMGVAFIFTNKTPDVESTWWHENVHIIYESLEFEDKEECGLAALNWLQKQEESGKKHYNKATTKYEQSSWGEEGAVRLVQYLIETYGAEVFLNSNFDGNEKISKLANAIRNKFIYGKEAPTEYDILQRRRIADVYGIRQAGGGMDRGGRKSSSSEGHLSMRSGRHGESEGIQRNAETQYGSSEEKKDGTGIKHHSNDAIKNRIEALFNQAISGEFKGKPISIGRLTDAGKAYLEKISGVAFRENIDFVLNPSDLIHIYKEHFGNNEKDKGQNVPLDIEDIRNLADVISNPDKVIFFKEEKGLNRNMFYFFKEAEDGTYNLMEIYSDKKGNLTAKTFYKTKKGSNQRVIDIEKSLLLTPETSLVHSLSDAKIPQMFETPSVKDNYSREGVGAYTDDEVSYENDPWAKVRERSFRTRRQRREFAERERQRMIERVETLAKKLHLDNVEIVTDTSTLEDNKQRAKGFYSKITGKITIAIPNHISAFDVEQTLLHEAVAHYGLRQLFGEHFDTFLDNVFNNADESIRKRISELAIKKYKFNFRKATEEYLATLAESTDFERANKSGWWSKIKEYFLELLHKIGFEDFNGVTLTDNELRYILWRSYENLAEPGRHRSILGEAADVAMQYDLKVGNYAESGNKHLSVAEATELSYINDRFNQELDDFNNKKHTGLLHLGYPMSILSAAGVNAKELTLSPKVLHQHLKKHGLTIHHLKGLAKAVQSPILVYRHGETHPNLVVVTELDVNGGKLSVALKLDVNGNVIEVNNVSSVHSKDGVTELERLSLLDATKLKGYLRWVEKEKVLDWLGIADLNRPMHTNNPELNSISNSNRNQRKVSDSLGLPYEEERQDSNPKLDSIAKVIENFENPTIEDDLLFRNGDPEIHERVLARQLYENRVKSGMYQSQEAIQDSMLGLKEAMQAILGKGKYIEDVDGFENAYLGENRLSSVNKAEADAFARLLFKPMLDEVAKLARNEAERLELTDYMMAKHGLERNEYMRQQAEANGEDADRDFAGLTALTGMDNVADAEAEAQQMVTDYEDAHDTTDLWEKVNAVSKAILQKSYECGMMSKETFDKVSGMYEYYIPLRGFDEKTSAEAYAYLSHKQSAFNAPIKKAEGRSSKADDPFANLQSMAEGAIMQGNRNKLVKQRFLNFVLNHPSDLVSVSDIWVEYDAVTDEWKPVFPDNIDSTDTPDEVEHKMQDFETKMEGLAQQYPDRYKHGKDAIGIPYRIVESRDMRQHQIVVKRGGRDYILTINGNPRAAQALNGQTNPDNDMSGAIGALLRAGEKINRQLSAFYTTRNPDFIVSNFMRDMLYTNTMVWIKESPNYALRFHRNYVMVNPVKLKQLLAKHRNGTLDMSNKTEAMFHQFMMNGGETGYANIRDIEQHKNDIRKELKKANGKLKIGRAMSLLAERFDELNRAVENCARFAAFVTSREMGRSIDRSIYDAKEISVNFNKKGSGAKFYDSVGQTRAGNAGALISGLGRSGYVFWNAAIQGTTNFGRQMKRHPAKAFTGVAAMFLLGAIVAYLGGDDDDKNTYYNLPEYVRRSNILFRAGDSWISIPLPIEYRAFYGMGELMTSIFNGKEHLTGGEIAEAIAGQATQMLPIDFLEGGGGLNAFVPSAARPLWEAYVAEKSWTGMPLYKDTPYNKDMPEWTKAYKSANKHIVGLAVALNEATGGDPYTKGGIDFNPAKVEYLLNGYFGGVFSTIDKMTKTAETIAGAREYDHRSVLIVNRLVKAGDERTEYRAVNNEYFRLKEEHDRLKTRLKHYEEDTDNGIFDYAEKIDFLYNSPEYERYEIFEDYRKDIDDLYDELQEAVDDEERKDIEAELNELKKEMISEMEYTRKRK